MLWVYGHYKYFYPYSAGIDFSHQILLLKSIPTLQGLKAEFIPIFTIAFPMIWRWAGDFFNVLLNFKMATTDQLQFFVGTKSQKLFEFYNLMPRNMDMCGDFFRILLKFKKATTSICLWSQKLKVRIYLNFTIAFPMIWRCAGDFFQVLLKFKMAAMDELHNFLWAHKLKN